jgi:hypothetical protein
MLAVEGTGFWTLLQIDGWTISRPGSMVVRD